MSTSSTQFSLFRDCIAQQLISRQKTDSDDTAELDEFVDFLAEEAWPTFPPVFQEATYQSRTGVPEAGEIDLDLITSPAFTDTLVSYGIVGDDEDAIKLLWKVAEDYRTEACAPPPVWSNTRTTECEICEREVPLTYHHLIPRSTHDKVLKRGWHDESLINSVAWLCRYIFILNDLTIVPLTYLVCCSRQCHGMVHRVERCEVLAREYYTVELLLQREDIQKWRKYVSKQRGAPRPKKAHKSVI